MTRWNTNYNKYGAKKTIVDGISFDSKKEAKRYQELTLMEKAGEIFDLQRQVKFTLIPSQRDSNKVVINEKTGKYKIVEGKVIERECAYIADFVYYNKDGEKIVEDAKGMKTEVYKIKKKLMLFIHGIQVKEV